MKRLIVGLDCDDCLMPCAEYAIQLANNDYGFNPPITLDEITSWGKTGKRTDVIFDYFNKRSFYLSQPVFPGAKAFVHELIERDYDVVIITAIYEEMTGIRIKRIQEEFPEIPRGNIVPSSRKDLCKVDVLLDDAPHNIFDTAAANPVLFRRPWNKDVTGIPAVNNYDEFLNLLTRIERQRTERVFDLSKPLLFCLIGPSGSGKTAITNAILEMNPGFGAPKSCTTRKHRNNEPKEAYYFVSNDEFERKKQAGELAEFTDYASCQYGVQKCEIEAVWNKGKHVIMPVDISGANSLKAIYGDRVVMCFVKRGKDEVVKEIIYRELNQLDKANPVRTKQILQDKYNRIISLEDEYKNVNYCDIIIPNNRGVEDAAQMLINFAM